MSGDERIAEWADAFLAEVLRNVGRFEEGRPAEWDDVDRIALYVLERANWHPPRPKEEQKL